MASTYLPRTYPAPILLRLPVPIFAFGVSTGYGFCIVQVLYLHSNKISELSDVAKLAVLPKLSKLTLHGNPAAACVSYRMSVPHHIASLRSLDFTAITRVDRESIANYSRGHEKRLAAR